MASRLNIGGSGSASSSASSSMDGDKMQKIKLGAAAGILVIAIGAIGWQMGWFEGGGNSETVPTPPAAPETPVAVDPAATTEDPANPGRSFTEAPPAPPIRRGGGLVAPGYDPNAPENQPQPEPPPPPSDGG